LPVRNPRSMKKTRALWLLAALCSAGCGSDSNHSFSAATPSTPLPKVAVDETPYQARAPVASDDFLWIHPELTGPVNLLANDLQRGGQVVSFDRVGSAGGTVEITPEGLLTYTPPAGQQTFRDVFHYSVKNASGTSEGTVTAQAVPSLYVDSQVAAGGDGSSARPFQTLSQALRLAGSSPAQIILRPGNGTDYGLEAPSFNLVEGQAILGVGSGGGRPTISATLNLATVYCGLQNLKLRGNIVARGNSPGTPQTLPLTLKNLEITDCPKEGILLEQPANTQVSDVFLNGAAAQLTSNAMTVHNPLGATVISNLKIQPVRASTAQPGLSIENDLATVDGSVILNGFTFVDQRDPFQVLCSAGRLNLTVENASPDSGLIGSLFRARISGNASVDALFSGIHVRHLGDLTNLMDWGYAGSSQGTVRWENNTVYFPTSDSSTDYTTSTTVYPSWNNKFLFEADDQAQANLVFNNAQLSRNTPMTVSARGQALLGFRMEKYSWKNPDNNSALVAGLQNNPVTLNAYDLSQIRGRLADNKGGSSDSANRDESYADWTTPLLYFSVDPNAVIALERFDQLGFDCPNYLGFPYYYYYGHRRPQATLPYLFFKGWIPGEYGKPVQITVNDGARQRWPNNYLDFPLDSLEIPKP
jgi:hypothetical protein